MYDFDDTYAMLNSRKGLILLLLKIMFILK